MVAAVLATGAAGCGEPTEPSPLTASITRSRAAQARGLVNVLLANPSAETVQVRELSIDDDRFVPLPPTERLVTVEPGAERLLVPVPIGAARCATVLDVPRVRTGDASIPVDEAGRRVLDAIVEDACALAAIERSASLAFVGAGEPVSPVAVDVVLRLERRRGSRAVTVDAVGSNVIFTASPDGLPATLAPSSSALDVTVRFSAERCEPHALAESKKTYQFPVWVALDDGPSAFVELTITGEARASLDRALNEGCAASER